MPTLVSGFQKFDPVDFEEGTGKLATILNLQRVLMSACQVEELEPDAAFLVTELALIDEAMESVENFKNLSKPWKRDTKLDAEAVKGEVIDQLFFVAQAAILLGMDAEEIFTRYKAKHTQNIERIIRKREGMDAPL